MTYRAFTVEEANELLPRLRDALRRVRSAREEARQHYEKVQILDALWGEDVTRPDNPDHDEYVRHREAISEATEAVRTTVEEEFRERGIRFPTGGLEHGLLDFPTSYEGRWVYLCWKLGEDRVSHWHEVDGGFRGREPITEEQARVMGREDDPEDLDDSVLDF